VSAPKTAEWHNGGEEDVDVLVDVDAAEIDEYLVAGESMP
jgi:hypothetical protein